MVNLTKIMNFRSLLVLIVLGFVLSSCVDWQKDPNSYYSNETKYINDLDSLENEYNKNLAYYFKKFNFKSVRDTSKFDAETRKKYEYW